MLKFVLLALANAAFHLEFAKKVPSGIAQGNGIAYLVQFELGNQTLEAQLDTGSSDLWVAAGKACLAPNCGLAYYPSSAFRSNFSRFEISYGDESSAQGVYARDTLRFDTAVVQGANFAAVYSANTRNVFGIGPKYSQACVRWKRGEKKEVFLDTAAGCTPYPNLPIQLRDQGITSTASYSIWLEKEVEGRGLLTFGGIAPRAINSSFYRLPIEKQPYEISQNGSYTSYPEIISPVVALNEMSVTFEDNTTTIYSGATQALLDYGSTLCMLPSGMAWAIAAHLGLDTLEVPCDARFNGHLTLDFRGVRVKVALEDFVRRKYKEGLPTSECVLGMLAAHQPDTLILGDNVLSSIYLTVDYDHGEVAIGQAAAETGQEIFPIPKTGIQAPKAPRYNELQEFTFLR